MVWRLMLCAGFAAVSLSAASAAEVRTAPLVGADGATHGTVTIIGAPKGVLLKVEATGLPPGWHGMHFHEKADCSTSGFAGAGAHVHAATPVVHGFLNAEANDNGDLPNLHVAADGKATVELYSTLVALQPGTGRPALLGPQGAAVIIHANPDDYSTQPIGGAGARIACAALH